MLRVPTGSSAFVVFSCLTLAGPLYATELVITGDNGYIGQVDTATGNVSNVHQLSNPPSGDIGAPYYLTDVAYAGGVLYGTALTSLYSINLNTGGATLIGTYSGERMMNALVGNGGALLGAAVDARTIYNVATNNAALTTYSV